MGNGKLARKRHHHKVLDQKKSWRTKRRTVDIDQVHTTLLTTPHFSGLLKTADVDLVGKGEHYCVPCARYFMNPGDLVRHEASKPHKKRLKLLKEPQYNHAEADRAGGLGSYTALVEPVYPVELSLMTTTHKEEVNILQAEVQAASIAEAM